MACGRFSATSVSISQHVIQRDSFSDLGFNLCLLTFNPLTDLNHHMHH